MSRFLLSLLLASLVTLVVSDSEQCPRYSPAEIWYSDYAPWLEQVLLEMKVYFKLIFGKLDDGNLFIFMPHIAKDPQLSSNMTSVFYKMRDMIINTMDKAYAEVEKSWLELAEVSDAFVKQGASPAAEMVVTTRLGRLHDQLLKENKRLDDGVREVALYFKALTYEAMEGISLMLEEELEEVPESEAEIAKLMQKKIFKIAPGDLLGSTLNRILGRGLGTNRAYSSDPILLNDVIARTDEMIKDFEIFGKDQPLTPETWEAFWKDQFDKSLAITNKRATDGKEDFDLIFRNEVYVAELLMNIMTHYD